MKKEESKEKQVEEWLKISREELEKVLEKIREIKKEAVKLCP